MQCIDYGQHIREDLFRWKGDLDGRQAMVNAVDLAILAFETAIQWIVRALQVNSSITSIIAVQAGFPIACLQSRTQPSNYNTASLIEFLPM